MQREDRYPERLVLVSIEPGLRRAQFLLASNKELWLLALGTVGEEGQGQRHDEIKKQQTKGGGK